VGDRRVIDDRVRGATEDIEIAVAAAPVLVLRPFGQEEQVALRR
jgi:hypothetical protein